MSRLYVTLKDTNCRAGSTISGEVELRGDDDINVQSISISMIGRCKTKTVKSIGDSSHTLRGRAPLIMERRVLFNGPSTLHPGHSWNFEFTIPRHCTERGQDRFNSDSGLLVGRFNYDLNQILPPMFSDEHGPAIAFISYVLEAHLVVDRRWLLSSKDILTTKTLHFLTTRSVKSPDYRMSSFSRVFERSSLALNPGHEGVPLTFKERMQSIYKSKIPTARFTLLLKYPKVAIVNQVTPLFLGVDHDFERSTAVAPPLIYLRRFSVDLLALTDAQYSISESRSTLRLMPDWGEQSWKTRYPVDSFECAKKGDPAQTGAPPVTEHLDLRDLMKLRLPLGQAPTFATFNIRRTYKLSIHLTIECAQQQFKAEFLTSDLLLLPGTYEATPGSELDNAPRNGLQEDEASYFSAFNSDETIPPAYTPGETERIPEGSRKVGEL